MGINSEIVINLFDLAFSPFIGKVQKGEIIIDTSLPRTLSIDEEKRIGITLHRILDEGFLVDELQDFTQPVLEHIYNLWKSAREYIKREESFEFVSDLLS